jgi:hypothetical protein
MLIRIVIAWAGASLPVSLLAGALLRRANGVAGTFSRTSAQPAPTGHRPLTPA